MSESLPTIRWGIVATGLISSWFVEDLILQRQDAKARHIIQAVGASSLEKGKEFVQRLIPDHSATVYGNYQGVYDDPDVDVVYIGTPNAFHKQNCLDATMAGKNILCEKAFTMNAAEAEEVIAAARDKNVYLMEAMWVRFNPVMQRLLKTIHEEEKIGDIRRVYSDFGLALDLESLGPESRLKNPALGAGTLLDIGIYSLTWAILCLDPNIGENAQEPDIVALQTIIDGADEATSVILKYPHGGHGIVTSTAHFKSSREFCRIEGSKGVITIEGLAAAVPEKFVFRPTIPDRGDGVAVGEPVAYEFPKKLGRGFYWEADAVALDILAGRKQNSLMPWAETTRVMKVMDEIRRQGGAVYPQDRMPRD